MQQRTKIFDIGGSVLHIAPEKNLKRILQSKESVSYISGDKHEPGYNHSRDTMSIDVTNLPFLDESFDAVICNHVLEHVLNDRKAMCEILRVLSPGSFAILQVPISLTLQRTFEDPLITSSKMREAVFGQSDHVRIYGQDYAGRLEEAGFSVIVDTLIDADYEIMGLNKDEKIYVAYKD